jgi:preprotein translocase subunit SecF
MFIIQNRKLFFIFSGVITAMGLLAMIAYYPWNYSIEFTGGSILEVAYPDGREEADILREKLDGLNWSGTQVQATGNDSYVIRTKNLTELERQTLVKAVSNDGAIKTETRRFNSIGPTIGAELRQKAWMAIGLVLLAIVLYIAFAFRHVSQPVSSWVYGAATIVSLLHNVIIPTGVYVALGHYFIDAQVDVLFITAILTILGFSVHDTIVVFDRTRENLRLRAWKEFDTTVGHSVAQTITRSINTSLTVLFMCLALWTIGGETTKYFALVLAIGITAGTYSSICIASPLLVEIEEWQRRREQAKADAHRKKKKE